MTNQTTKKEKVTENDEGNGIASIFRRDILPKADYHFEGCIDIENLRFWAMHPEIGMSVVSTDTANALQKLINVNKSILTMDLPELGDLTELGKLGEFGIFKTPTSLQKNGVYGFRLNETKAKNAIQEMVERLQSLHIRRGANAKGKITKLEMQMVYITTKAGVQKTRKTAFMDYKKGIEELQKTDLYSHWIHTPEPLLKVKVNQTAKDEKPTDGLAYINFSGTIEGYGVLNYVEARDFAYYTAGGEKKTTKVASARTTREGFAKISSNCLRHEIFKADEPVNVRGRSEGRPSFVDNLSNLSGLFRGFCYMEPTGGAIKHTGFTITDAVSNEKPESEFFSSSGPRKN